jgi:transposase
VVLIDSPRFCQSKPLHGHQGLTASQIAQAVARDRRTVASWLAQEPFRPRKPRQAPRTRDPCKPDMVRLLARSPSSAAQVFQRLRAHRFDGSSALVKASVRPVRPRRPAALLTLACAPGAWAQGDWGACGSVPVGHTPRQRRCFVMVLCSSRMLDVECPVSQTMAHVLACHQHALDFCGGMPHTGMVDNLTSAGLTRAVGEAPGLHPTSLDFATHHDCPMAPCHVGKGKEQGRVENGVGSVKKPCLAGLDLPDFSARTPAARHGRDTVATVRLHGDTREQPTVLGQTERPSWRPVPLPPCALATGSPVRASQPLRLTVETNRSAVPAPDAGHALTLQTSPDRLGVSLGDTRIARQARRDDRPTDVEDPDHPKPLLAQRKKARAHTRCLRFLALSPRAEASDRTREERRLTPPHHGRTMVALSDIDAPAAVSRAMEDALVSEACSSAYMANLVEQRARCTPEASALHLTRRGDLLDVSLAPPDVRMYHAPPQPGSPDTEEEPPQGCAQRPAGAARAAWHRRSPSRLSAALL